MCWLLLVELGLRAEPYPWQSESVVDVKRELVYLIYFAYWPIHRYITQALVEVNQAIISLVVLKVKNYVSGTPKQSITNILASNKIIIHQDAFVKPMYLEMYIFYLIL